MLFIFVVEHADFSIRQYLGKPLGLLALVGKIGDDLAHALIEALVGRNQRAVLSKGRPELR